MGWFAINLISAFLLPPFNLILLGTAGLVLLKWRPRLGTLLITATLTLLYLLSTPFFAELMLQRLETRPPLGPINTLDNGVQAIVVLGSSTYFDAPEYGGHTVSRFALERIRYAAWLYRLTGKPILATGGSPPGSSSSEADQMKAVLETEFHVPVSGPREGRSTHGKMRTRALQYCERTGSGVLRWSLMHGICRARRGYSSRQGLRLPPPPPPIPPDIKRTCSPSFPQREHCKKAACSSTRSLACCGTG